MLDDTSKSVPCDSYGQELSVQSFSLTCAEQIFGDQTSQIIQHPGDFFRCSVPPTGLPSN